MLWWKLNLLSSKNVPLLKKDDCFCFCCPNILFQVMLENKSKQNEMRTELIHQSVSELWSLRGKKNPHVTNEIYIPNTCRFLYGCQMFCLKILSQRLHNIKYKEEVSHTHSEGHCTILLPISNQSPSVQCSYFINQSIFTWFSTWWSKALFLFICSDQLIHSASGLEVVSAQPASCCNGVDFPFGLYLGLGEMRNQDEKACVLLLVGGRCRASWGCPFFFLSFFASPASLPALAFDFVGIEVISVRIFTAVTPPIWPICSTVADVLFNHYSGGWVRDQFITCLKSKCFQACLSAYQVILERRLKVGYSHRKDLQKVSCVFLHFPHHTYQ